MSLKWTLKVQRRQLLDRLHRIVQHRQVVAGVEAHAEVFAVVVLEQGDLLIDAPVLVILDAERHPVPLDDRDGGRDLGMEAGDGLLPVVEAWPSARSGGRAGTPTRRLVAPASFATFTACSNSPGSSRGRNVWISRYMSSSSFIRRVRRAHSKLMSGMPPWAPAAPTSAASVIRRSAPRRRCGVAKRIDWKESGVRPMLVRLCMRNLASNGVPTPSLKALRKSTVYCSNGVHGTEDANQIGRVSR